MAYNRAGAMGYALSQCSDATPRCPVGISYDGDLPGNTRCPSGGDCAHFVSHCLSAGGLSNYTSVGHNLSGSSCYASNGIIIRAVDQHDWLLSGGRGVARAAANALYPGDVISYDWDGVNGWNHVTMVVGNDGHGDVRICSHTSYRCNDDWTMGKPSRRYEFIHILAPPPAPSSPSPASGSTFTDTLPGLGWTALGASHQVQVAADPAFSGVVVDVSGLASPGVTLPAWLPAARYYWRARAGDADGSSPWSATWQFDWAPCGLEAADRPQLRDPADGASLSNTRPLTFTWSAVFTATHYSLAWIDSQSLTQTFVSQVLSFTLPFSPTFGHYTWRVQPANICGYGAWSDGRSLTVTDPNVRPSFLPYVLN